MSTGVGSPDPPRAYLLDRVLFARWTHPRVRALGYGLAAAPLLVAGMGWMVPPVLGFEPGDPFIRGYPWVPGLVLGAVLSVVVVCILVASAMGGTTAERCAARVDAPPWRLRPARRVMRSGELSDDAGANRIAATVAYAGLLRRPRSPSRSDRTFLLMFACVQLLMFVSAFADGSGPRMLAYGILTAYFVLMGTGVVSAQSRALVRRRRVVALRAAETWSAHLDSEALRESAVKGGPVPDASAPSRSRHALAP